MIWKSDTLKYNRIEYFSYIVWYDQNRLIGKLNMNKKKGLISELFTNISLSNVEVSVFYNSVTIEELVNFILLIRCNETTDYVIEFMIFHYK